MIQLLLELSWYLLGLSIALFVCHTIEFLLRNNRPVVARWFSWLSVALSCFIAAMAVIFIIGYTATLLHSTHGDEAICAAFGLKESPHSTRPVATEHPKVNASAVEVFWVAFTGEYPLLEKWLRCIAVGLCLVAIMAFVVVLTVVPSDRRTTSYQARRFIVESADTLKNTSPAGKGNKGMKSSEAIIHKSSLVGMQRRTEGQHLLGDRWGLYASISFICMSLVAVILLDYYADLNEHDIIKDKCVPLEYVPQELEPKGKNGHAMTTVGLESLRSPFHIVSREEWMAKPPKKNTLPLQHPVGHVVLSHTPLGSCSSYEDCIVAIRSIQEINMGPRDGVWDISTNFLIARDGRAYEGMGWNTTANDTGLYTNGTLSVMFSGTSLRTTPTTNQQKAFEGLIGEGIRVGYIAKAYEIVVSPKSAWLKKLYN